MPSKKKRPAPLDLSIIEQDAQSVTLSTKTLPQNNQPATKKKKIITKRKKRGPYDPEVFHFVEQIRLEGEAKLSKEDNMAKQLDEAIQQMTPVNSPVKAVLETTTLLEEGEDPPRICPFHMATLGPVVNNKGYHLTRCTDQPCLISVFNDENAEAYLHGVYNKVHKDIHDLWGKLLCDCGFLPGLRQSKSEKNPDRMYLACRQHQCKYFDWADQPLADPEDVMTCPRHLEKMEERTAKTGWQYLRCPAFTCFLFCGKEQGPKYMLAVRKEIHPDICHRWDKINCLCGHVPVLKQSFSDKNPDRLYLSCGNNNQCKFFRWADQPVQKENMKDPLAVQDWLQDCIPDLGESYNGKEIRPPIYGEGLPQAKQRLQQTYVDPFQANFEKDYVPLHPGVIENGKLGLF